MIFFIIYQYHVDKYIENEIKDPSIAKNKDLIKFRFDRNISSQHHSESIAITFIIASIPLLADTLFDDLTGHPLTVYALPETIKALKDHIFNWTIWPDFTELPHKANAVLKLEATAAGSVIELSGRQIEVIRVNHSVPGAAYCIKADSKVFAFSGDTTSNENFWVSLNKYDSLDLLFVESAFANKDIELAKVAFHYCPTLLAEDLHKLKHRTKVCISHLKPGCEQEIIEQCKTALPDWDIHQLKSGDVFNL